MTDASAGGKGSAVEEEPVHDPFPANLAPPVPTEAHRLALESTEEFTGDGFRIRDAEWPFTLINATPLFLQVTLFAGNRYWFITATPFPGANLRVTLYDASGHPVSSEQRQKPGAGGGSRAAAGLTPERSGTYFVGVEALNSLPDQPLDCSLVSAYR
jgi:hypothetical protein